MLFNQNTRHRMLQRFFWNDVGSAFVGWFTRYERMFDVVVRNYSLNGGTNGERWLLSLLDNAPVVFDVGFHDGASTKEILRARPNSNVTGFDPSRFALENYTREFLETEQVTFANVGLSNCPGHLNFFDYDNMCNSFVQRREALESPAVYTVPVTTLDEYCRIHAVDRINFLKIDAEGFDLNVLEGAREALFGQCVDIFVFEFASGWAASKRYLWEVLEYLEPLPYTLYRLFNGFLCPLIYDVRIDSACTLSAMYVGISDIRLERGDIPLRHYNF